MASRATRLNPGPLGRRKARPERGGDPKYHSSGVESPFYTIMIEPTRRPKSGATDLRVGLWRLFRREDMLSVHIRRVAAMAQATFLSISLLLSVTCSGKREGTRHVTTVRTSPGVVPGGLSVRKTFLNVISSVPLKPVPRPLPPELGSDGSLVSARFDYEVAVQKYAVAQLRGLDEETERALRRRVPQTGWTELGFVPFALVSYEAATIRSVGSFAFVRLRVDRGDPWNPEWTTYFGEVAVQCRPKPMRFQLVTVHAGQEKAVSATYDEKEPTRVAATGAVIAKLCSELRLLPASKRR